MRRWIAAAAAVLGIAVVGVGLPANAAPVQKPGVTITVPGTGTGGIGGSGGVVKPMGDWWWPT